VTSWRLIDSGPCEASFNMALDEALSISVREDDSPPILRFYSWSGLAVSLGAFQKLGDIDAEYCSKRDIPIVRRPTGGRAILHGDEFTYSFSATNDGLFSGGLRDSYRKLGGAFGRCFDLIGLTCAMKNDRESGRELVKSPLCFASTSVGEITSSGIKIIGSAQKRWTEGFLQQGTIPFSIDHRTLSAILKAPFNGGPRDTDCGVCTGLRALMPDFDPETFRRHLICAFEETFGVTLVNSQPCPQELEIAHQLASEKYRQYPWSLGGVREAKADNRSDNNAERATLG
jgi:lipoyl(octanoyl) transferase